MSPKKLALEARGPEQAWTLGNRHAHTPDGQGQAESPGRSQTEIACRGITVPRITLVPRYRAR